MFRESLDMPQNVFQRLAHVYHILLGQIQPGWQVHPVGTDAIAHRVPPTCVMGLLQMFIRGERAQGMEERAAVDPPYAHQIDEAVFLDPESLVHNRGHHPGAAVSSCRFLVEGETLRSGELSSIPEKNPT